MVPKAGSLGKNLVLACAAAATLAFCTLGAWAQAKDNVVVTGDAAKRSLTKNEISGETAAKIAQVCQDFARQHNFAAIIFILDPFGNVVHAHRMDGVRPVQFESAINKAKTALTTRMSTSQLADRVGNDQVAQVRLRLEGLDWGAGGLPIIVDNQLIGAIGPLPDPTLWTNRVQTRGSRPSESRPQPLQRLKPRRNGDDLRTGYGERDDH